MKLAIMQPYFFPYLGYYQLVGAVDFFIFYDDVNFIRKGWINRTNIVSKEGKLLLSISLSRSSQNKYINEIELIGIQDKIIKSIEYTYKKAPYFQSVFPMIESCIKAPYRIISEYAANSIMTVSKYLDLKTEFSFSSDSHKSTGGYAKARRLIDICRKENADIYINSIGGQAIYTKEEFEKHGIQLFFLKNNDNLNYNQNPIRKDTFEPNLSIIDVLMFNDKETVKEMLNNFALL
jgi:hypothetical protein